MLWNLFAYDVFGNIENSVCPTVTVTLTILKPPHTNNDNFIMNVNDSVNIPVLTNDVGDYNVALTIKKTDPSNGRVSSPRCHGPVTKSRCRCETSEIAWRDCCCHEFHKHRSPTNLAQGRFPSDRTTIFRDGPESTPWEK